MRGVTKKAVFLVVVGWFQSMIPSVHSGSQDAFARLHDFKDRVFSGRPEHIVIYSKKDDDSDEKIARKGFLYAHPNAVGTIIVCHGYQSSKEDASVLKKFMPDGFNIVVFDFRAHGENKEDQFSTLGYYEKYDVLGAAEYVRSHPALKDKPLIGYGVSMGSVSLIEAQATNPVFDALILDCPYDSTDTSIERGFSNLKFTLWGKEYMIPAYKPISKIMYDERYRPIMKQVFAWVSKFDPDRVPTKFMPVHPVESMKQITVPVLFIHCIHDGKVPVEAIERVYKAKKFGYKRLWLTGGRHHADSYISQPDEYAWMIAKFLTKYVQGRLHLGRQERVVDVREQVEKDGQQEVASMLQRVHTAQVAA